MNNYEKQYIDIIGDTIKNGVYQTNKRTGVGTYCIPSASMKIDISIEFPILKSKFVNWKTAIKEIFWIMRDQSNNINDLDGHIWDSWADNEGSIGKAYGYQVAKPIAIDGKSYSNQVEYVLETLRNDPTSRRAVINLWSVDDLGDMNLTPCCFSSIWTILDNKLNCTLIQRSADLLVGVPFNTTQYAALTLLFARDLGVEPGQLFHVMVNCHIYDFKSHINGQRKMIDNYLKIMLANNKDYKEILLSTPKLVINPDKSDFFSMEIDDIQLEDYKYAEKIKFDVAV